LDILILKGWPSGRVAGVVGSPALVLERGRSLLDGVGVGEAWSC